MPKAGSLKLVPTKVC